MKRKTKRILVVVVKWRYRATGLLDRKKRPVLHERALGIAVFFFYQRVPLIFHFSQLSGISLAQKQQASLQKIILNVRKFLQRIFCWAKTNQVDNSYLSTPNFKCLAPKLVKFESHYNILVTRVYTLRCNRRYILLDLSWILKQERS